MTLYNNYHQRLNIYNKLSQYNKDYINSTISTNNTTELENQLGVNFIPIYKSDHLIGISTEIIEINDTFLQNKKSFAIPIIVYNSKKWRETFPRLFEYCISNIKNKDSINEIDIVEVYTNTIYNTCILYLKSSQSQLIKIICHLIRTLFFLISEFKVKPSIESDRIIYKNKFKTLIKQGKDINQYKHLLNPSDWYWCIYTILLENDDMIIPINIWDLIIGMITQPFLGKTCYTYDTFEEKLLEIILSNAMSNINIDSDNLDLNDCDNIQSTIINIHRSVGNKFENFLVCNAFVIEIFRSIFLNPAMIRLCYSETICIDIIVRQLIYIKNIYSNLHGITTLCISISPNSYVKISEQTIAELIAQYIYEKKKDISYLYDPYMNTNYLNRMTHDNNNFYKNSHKNISKLCNNDPLFKHFTHPYIRHTHVANNRHKFISTLLPFIIEGNKIEIVKNLIDNSIKIVPPLVGKKKLMKIIYRFSPENSPVREYYKDELPKMNTFQHNIYPKWLKRIIKYDNNLKDIITYYDTPKIKKITYIPMNNSIDIIAKFQKQLAIQSELINATCLLCLNTYKEFKSLHGNHRVCQSCFEKIKSSNSDISEDSEYIDCPFCS